MGNGRADRKNEYGETVQERVDQWMNGCEEIRKRIKKLIFRKQYSASCIQAGATATQTNFQVLTSSNAEFDFICDS